MRFEIYFKIYGLKENRGGAGIINDYPEFRIGTVRYNGGKAVSLYSFAFAGLTVDSCDHLLLSFLS